MRSSTRPTSDSNSKNKARYPTIKQQPLSTNAWSEFGLSNCVRSTEFNLILITESSDGYPFRLRGITWTHMQGRRQVADRRRGLATKTLKWRLITDPTRTSFFYSHLNVKDAPVDAALHQKTNTQTQVASRESRQFNRHDKMANDENVMQLQNKKMLIKKAQQKIKKPGIESTKAERRPLIIFTPYFMYINCIKYTNNVRLTKFALGKQKISCLIVVLCIF